MKIEAKLLIKTLSNYGQSISLIKRKPRTLTSSKDGSSEDIQRYAQEIAAQAWKGSKATGPITLDPRTLLCARTNAEIVAALLDHARKVAPGLHVPMLIPSVRLDSNASSVGQFVVEDGWVSITVGTNFFLNRQAACAILAHEVCHYILESSSMKKNNVLANERFTDCCMYICGFGDVFRRGHITARSDRAYESYRLGYLNDKEYDYLGSFVTSPNCQGIKVSTNTVKSLQQDLASLIPDKSARERVVKHRQQRFPSQQEEAILRDLIEDLRRERS